MSTAAVRGVVRQLGLADPADPPSDAALLTRYARQADHAAFAELLRRHGPMVLGACRRVLGDPHAAEDAFQATFLVLSVKAGAVCPPGSVGGWLYGVAVNVARKARAAAARRWRREMTAAARDLASRGCEPPESADRADLRAVIDEELGRLPDTLRSPVVLCDLGGKTRSEAARELGCPEGTVAARLHKARRLLADRLTRRGVALPAAGFAVLLAPEAVSAELARSALAAAGAFAAGVATSAVPPVARSLAEGMIRAMTTGKLKLVFAVVAAGLLAGGGILWGASGQPRDADPDPVIRGPMAANDVVRNPAADPKANAAADPKANAAAEWKQHKSLTDHEDFVDGVAFSPDGKTFVTGGGGTVILWDAATLNILWKSKLGDPDVTAVAFSPDGKRIAATHPNGVTLFDAATGKAVQEIEEKTPWDPPTAVAFGAPKAVPDHLVNRLAFGSRVTLWAKTWIDGGPVSGTQYGPPMSAKGPPLGPLAGVAYSPDGERLVFIPNQKIDPEWLKSGKSGDMDPKKATHYYALIWGAGSGKPMQPLPLGTDPVTAVAWSRDGKLVAVGGATGDVALFDPATGKEGRRMHVGGRSGQSVIRALAFTPDGKTLGAAVEYDEGKNANRIVMFDLATGDRKQDLQFFWKSPVVAFAFSPDGRTLVAACGHLEPEPRKQPAEKRKEAGEVQVWRLDAADKKPQPAAEQAAPVVDGKQAAVADGWKEREVIPISGPVCGVAVAPDGKRFAVGIDTADAAVQLWDAKQLKLVSTARRPNKGVHAVAFAPDGKALAVGGDQNVIRVEVPSAGDSWRGVGDPLAFPWATALAFSPDGKRLAASDGFTTVIRPVDGDGNGVTINGPRELGGRRAQMPAGLAWSPDGKTLAHVHPIAEGRWVVGLADSALGLQAKALAGSEGRVQAVAWSADGRVIATGGADGTVSLWDATAYQQQRRLAVATDDGATGWVFAVAISPDGKTVAAGAEWRTGGPGLPRHVLFLWDVATGKELARFSYVSGGRFVSLAFTADGATLVGGREWVAWPGKRPGESGAVVVWER
jgi:RNA polymerase sigma factor (sigma-70 family)